MKVLFNALQVGNRSGTGRYTEELAQRLPGRAPDIDVHIVTGDAGFCKRLAQSTLLRTRDRRGVARIFYEQFGLLRDARSNGADGVHYPASVGPISVRSASVLTVHDLSFFRNPSWFRLDRALYYRVAVGQSAHTARRLIVDSRATADDVIHYLGIPASSIDVVPLGVDDMFRSVSDDTREGVRGKYKLPNRFFLYMGTLEPRKNLVRLIAAWNRVAAVEDIDLVIAGRNGWKTGAIRRAIVNSEFRDRIHLPGFIEHVDLPGVYGAATAFVWPSLCEGFGLPVLEAMACAVPVLTSNTSSLPEVAGEAALLVDPDDVKAIENGMIRILRDEKLRDTLTVSGPVQASRFTWERTASMTLDSYRRAFA